jgi:hypothetical protein
MFGFNQKAARMEKSKEGLQKYAETWPEAGYEFRKQYVVLQTV